MGKLTGQTIADSYDQLLIVDGASGITSSLQAVESADTGSSSSALSISTIAISVAGNATITTADNTDTLSLISTDADAAVGPNINLYRNSASPADFDALGSINFTGVNDADPAQDVVYCSIGSYNIDVSDSTEDGELTFRTMVAGTLQNRMDMIAGETSFNEAGIDVNFRVESADNANMIFVDGGANAVGIGTATPQELGHLFGTGSTALRVSGGNNNNKKVEIGYDNTNGPYIKGGSSGVTGLQFYRDNTVLAMEIESGGVDAGDVTISTGNLVIGTSGKGISFAATSDAGTTTPSELLDDYEEGNWTADLDGTTSDPDSAIQDTAARYTKIGNVVYWSFNFSNYAATGASGNTRISGLPFTTNNVYASKGIFGSNGLILSGEHQWLELPVNATIIYLFYAASAGGWQYEAIDTGSGSYLIGQGWYTV